MVYLYVCIEVQRGAYYMAIWENEELIWYTDVLEAVIKQGSSDFPTLFQAAWLGPLNFVQQIVFAKNQSNLTPLFAVIIFGINQLMT